MPMKNIMQPRIIERSLHQWRPEAEIDSISDVSGIAHSTYIINLKDVDREEVVVKLCPDERFKDRFKIEPFITDFIKRSTDIPAPDIIFSDFTETVIDCPYYISEKIEGHNLGNRFKHLPKETRKQVLFEAGRKLGELHRDTKMDNFGILKSDDGRITVETRQDWPNTFREFIERKLQEIEKTPFRHLLPRIRSTIRANLSVIDLDMQPRLLHQDLRPDNILVKDGEITSVLDWEGALVGHKEYDLFKAEREFIDLYFKNEDVKKEYMNYLFNGYNQVERLEEGWRQRRRFYKFTYLIGALSAYPDWKEIYSGEERYIKQRQLIEKIKEQSLISHDMKKARLRIDALV